MRFKEFLTEQLTRTIDFKHSPLTVHLAGHEFQLDIGASQIQYVISAGRSTLRLEYLTSDGKYGLCLDFDVYIDDDDVMSFNYYGQWSRSTEDTPHCPPRGVIEEVDTGKYWEFGCEFVNLTRDDLNSLRM